MRVNIAVIALSERSIDVRFLPDTDFSTSDICMHNQCNVCFPPTLIAIAIMESWKSNRRVFVLEHLAAFHWGIQMLKLNCLTSRWHS